MHAPSRVNSYNFTNLCQSITPRSSIPTQAVEITRHTASQTHPHPHKHNSGWNLCLGQVSEVSSPRHPLSKRKSWVAPKRVQDQSPPVVMRSTSALHRDPDDQFVCDGITGPDCASKCNPEPWLAPRLCLCCLGGFVGGGFEALQKGCSCTATVCRGCTG